MLQLKCANGHEYSVDYFCTNQYCKEKRLYCFEQCQKIQSCHSGHSQHTDKIHKLWSYVNGISEQCFELVKELEIQFQKVQDVFQQFKNNLLSKYSLFESIFIQLNSNQINQALCNFVGFDEETNKISNQFKQITHQFIQSLEDCSEAYQILHFDYQESAEENHNHNSNPFSYVLMSEENKLYEQKGCCSFAFNNDASVIFAGLDDGEIKIFDFTNELMKFKQNIKNHTDAIYSLQFMKKSNKFVSGSADQSIIIWSLNNQQVWLSSQKLIGHSGIILCLIIDVDENIISSGNAMIKIWDKQTNYQCFQELNENQGDITQISLNPQQNFLISCMESQNQIVVYQKKNKFWKFYQKIEVELWGFRLCFINNTIFTFQPYTSQLMEIYEKNKKTNFFTKINQIQVNKSSACDALFPQQYIRQKSILINKNGQFINLFRIKPFLEIQAQEPLYFRTELIYGALSLDAQYLITWDVYSQQIEIRKYKEEEID